VTARTAALRDLDLRPLRDRRAFAGAELPPTGFFKRPRLPPGVRFALCLDRLLRPGERNPFAVKPWAFATIDDLAMSLHRRRAGRMILLSDAPLLLEPRRCPDTPRHGVSVHAECAGGRREFLAWAYIDGQPQQALAQALRRTRLSWER
jgi:hypothetical protein